MWWFGDSGFFLFFLVLSFIASMLYTCFFHVNRILSNANVKTTSFRLFSKDLMQITDILGGDTYSEGVYRNARVQGRRPINTLFQAAYEQMSADDRASSTSMPPCPNGQAFSTPTLPLRSNGNGHTSSASTPPTRSNGQFRVPVDERTINERQEAAISRSTARQNLTRQILRSSVGRMEERAHA